MDYWEVRKAVSKIVPRMSVLKKDFAKTGAVKEKGRKRNYHQYNLKNKEWTKQERLLNTEEINSFLEISIRAQACPLPFNMDIWDGLLCIAEGSLITTKRGEVPIEDVVVGDIVLTMNEETKELEWNAVTKTRTTEKSNMLKLETEVGDLWLTDDHPVYTQRGWIKAGELKKEDSLYTFGTD